MAVEDIVKMVGSTLNNPKGEAVDARQVLSGKQVGLYFSSGSCPPCRDFTKRLKKCWRSVVDNGKDWEVVFVSVDRNEDEYNDYLQQLLWPGVPWRYKDIRANLKRHFRVETVPALVMLDEEGKVITHDGREAVSNDEAGSSFPWEPPTLSKCLVTTVVKDGVRLGMSRSHESLFRTAAAASQTLPHVGSASSLSDTSVSSSVCEGDSCVLINRDAAQQQQQQRLPEVDDGSGGNSGRGGIIGAGLRRLFRRGNSPDTVVRCGDGDETTQSQAVENLSKHHIALFFGAGWSPASAHFSKRLEDTYREIVGVDGASSTVSDSSAFGASASYPNPNDNHFEIVYVSRDHTEHEYSRQVKGMPWAALRWDDPCRDMLSRHFSVESLVPRVVMLSPEDEHGERTVLNADAIPRILAAGASPKASFPWVPLLVNDLEDECDGVNDCPSVVVLMEESEQLADSIEAAMVEAASAAKRETDASGSSNSKSSDRRGDVKYFTGRKSGEVTRQIRRILKLGRPTGRPELLLLDFARHLYFRSDPSIPLTAEKVLGLVSLFQKRSLDMRAIKTSNLV